MITVNADWRTAARNALHSTAEAEGYSNLISSTFHNPNLRTARNAASAALNIGSRIAMLSQDNTRSESYRALLAHETARSAHKRMSDLHRGIEDRWRAQHGDFAPGPEPRERYSDSHYRVAALHDKAAEAHDQAAHAA